MSTSTSCFRTWRSTTRASWLGPHRERHHPRLPRCDQLPRVSHINFPNDLQDRQGRADAVQRAASTRTSRHAALWNHLNLLGTLAVVFKSAGNVSRTPETFPEQRETFPVLPERLADPSGSSGDSPKTPVGGPERRIRGGFSFSARPPGPACGIFPGFCRLYRPACGRKRELCRLPLPVCGIPGTTCGTFLEKLRLPDEKYRLMAPVCGGIP
jgi:hypothetical protein